LLPDPDISAATIAANNTYVPAVIAERLEILAHSNFDQVKTGYAAGGASSNGGIWIKGLGGIIRQGERQGFVGYNANTAGYAFGADAGVLPDTWVGLGFSSVSTHITSREQVNKKTNLQSHQLTAYGSYSPGNFYLDFLGAMAVNNYKTLRNIEYINQVATAEFKGVQPLTKLSGGYAVNLENFQITPHASLQYSVLYQDSYKESGAAGVSLENVSGINLSQLEAGIGVKFSMLEDDDDDRFYHPYMNFMVLHDLKAASQETTAKFSGGGGSFKITSATPDKTTYNMGVGVVFMHKNHMQLTANYELRKKDKFVGQSGSIAVRYEI
jgi:outer membrane autotransporter protein